MRDLEFLKEIRGHILGSMSCRDPDENYAARKALRMIEDRINEEDEKAKILETKVQAKKAFDAFVENEKKTLLSEPDWWPTNPYPESVFAMTIDEYVKAVPDTALRSAISGRMARFGWEQAEKAIWERLRDAFEEEYDQYSESYEER